MAAEGRIRTPEEILEMALRREQTSFQFYSRLVDQSAGVEIIRTLLDQLKDEELRHVRMIEKKLTHLRLG